MVRHSDVGQFEWRAHGERPLLLFFRILLAAVTITPSKISQDGCRRNTDMLLRIALICILPVMMMAVLAGCGGSTNATNGTANDSSKNTAAGNSTAKDAGQAEDLPGLKELDEADRKLAEKQKVCPVSGSPLGTADMGKPYKMTVKGRVIFLCCDGCKKAVEKDKDGILKKVDALMAKK